MDDLNKLLASAMAEVAAANDKGMQLGRKKYTTVAVRVEVFRKVFGMRGRIRTEMLHADADTVVMQAHIEFLHDSQWHEYANGYAEEKRNSSQVNRTSAVENCESSAVGRALANLGLHGGEYASANEVENAIHQQGQPEPTKVALISDEQAANLQALATEADVDTEKFFGWFSSATKYAVSRWADIHATDYDRALKALEAKRAKGAA